MYTLVKVKNKYNITMLVFVLLVVLACFIEIILSKNTYASALFIISLIISTYIVRSLSFHFYTVIIFAFVCKLLIIPFFIKIIYMESITLHMKAANSTSELVLIAVIFCSIATFIHSYTTRRLNGVISLEDKCYNLQVISYVFVSLGIVFLLLHVSFAPVLLDGNDEGGFGGFGSLVSIGYLGIIIYIYNKKKSGMQYFKFDISILVILFMFLLVSFIANTKQEFVTACLSVFFSIIFFRIKIRAKNLFQALFVLILIVTIVSPLIHQTRSLEFRNGDFQKKIEVIINYFNTNNSVQTERTVDYRDNYFPVNGHIFDRLDILEETDLVVSGIDSLGYVGWYPIYDGFKSAMPSFIVTDKSDAAVTDKIMWDIREKNIDIISRVTIGVTSSLYAVNGLISVILFFPFIIYIFVCFLSYIFGSKLNNNILSVFFLVKYLLFFTEKTFEGLLIIMLRDLPITLVQIYLVLYIISNVKVKKSFK